jgi:hypothetical protein
MSINNLTIISFLTLILFSGCSSKFEHKISFNQYERIRIAVMPFRYLAGTESEEAPPTPNLLIDNVPIVSEKLKQTPTKYIRTLVQNELKSTVLEIIDPFEVEIELPHHGFGKIDGTFDLNKIFNSNPDELCVHHLQCDAVLLGTIYSWDRSYYGIESVSTVDLGLKIISAKNGRTLYEVRGKDNISRGISGIPTGFSDLVVEPLRGLDNEIIEDLAREIVRKLIEPLKVNQEDLNRGSPPSIYAVVHDAVNGDLAIATNLTVLAYGTPQLQASFRIGEVTGDLPMLEKFPGHYVGTYIPFAQEKVIAEKVIVSIRDKYGRITEAEILQKPVTLKILKKL